MSLTRLFRRHHEAIPAIAAKISSKSGKWRDRYIEKVLTQYDNGHELLSSAQESLTNRLDALKDESGKSLQHAAQLISAMKSTSPASAAAWLTEMKNDGTDIIKHFEHLNMSLTATAKQDLINVTRKWLELEGKVENMQTAIDITSQHLSEHTDNTAIVTNHLTLEL